MIQYFTPTGSNSISGKDIMKLEDDFERDNYNEQPKPLPLDVKSGDAYLVRSLSNNNYIPIKNKYNISSNQENYFGLSSFQVVFNSLANDIYEVISFFVEDVRVVSDLCITDPNEDSSKKFLKYQVRAPCHLSPCHKEIPYSVQHTPYLLNICILG